MSTTETSFIWPLQEDRQASHESKNDRGGVCQDKAPEETADDCKPYYSAERLRGIGTRKTGLRAADRHASWKEVAYACHVQPGR